MIPPDRPKSSLIDDGYLVEPEPVDERIPHHPKPYRLVPDSPRRGCSVLGFLAFVTLVLVIAVPRSAPDHTAPQPGAPGTTGSVGAPARAQASASGPELSGAPHDGVTMVADSRAFDAPSSVSTGGAPAPTGEVSPTAISSGIASWYPAAGDVAAVPWWLPGQDPVWAEVSTFRGGRTLSVTVLIMGWCECLTGTPRERAIDLSRHAFAQLADPDLGTIVVQIEIGRQGPRLPATDGEK